MQILNLLKMLSLVYKALVVMKVLHFKVDTFLDIIKHIIR